MHTQKPTLSPAGDILAMLIKLAFFAVLLSIYL